MHCKSLSIVLACLLPASTMILLKESLAQDNDTSKRTKIAIAKETTYFTEPLDEKGDVDFVAAVNRHYSRGVTPQNNLAAAAIMAAGIDRSQLSDRVQNELARSLGIEQMPGADKCLVDFDEFANDMLDELQRNYVDLQTSTYPWSRKEFAIAAMWIDKFAPIVDRYVEQLDLKTTYFLPVISSDDHPGSLMFAEYYHTNVRRLARYLKTRALMRLGQNDVDGCMNDLIAIRKTALLVCNGKNWIELLTGFAIKGIGEQAEIQMCMHNDFKKANLDRYISAIERIPFSCDIASLIDQYDRFLFLNVALRVKNGDTSCFEYWLASVNQEPIPPYFIRSVRRLIDWDMLLKQANSRLTKTVELIDDGSRLETLDRLIGLEKEFTSNAKSKELPGRLWRLLASTGEAKSVALLDEIEHQISSKVSYQTVYSVYCEKMIWEDLFRMNLALHKYRFEKGEFPASLAELKPTCVKTVPDDQFSNKPLIYRKIDEHFLLYSVGRNRFDDGGNITSIHKDLGLTSNREHWNARYKDDE